LGNEYAVYAAVFEQNQVDGYWLLNYVNEEKLKQYGIDNAAHRQFILEKIEKLKGESEVTLVSDRQ
jgi:hypothetical protein